MIKKGMILMLAVSMVLGSLAGCNGAPADNASTLTSATQETLETVPAPTDAPVEAQLPLVSGNTISMYYDDRLPLTELTAGEAAVEIVEQQPTSKITGSQDTDAAVAIYSEQSGCLIAVGTGTAVVRVNDAQYQLTVEAAPISLLMITGHSIGAGQTGVKAQSVLCEAGTAYSSYGVSTASGDTQGMGIGYAAASKPKGIDDFTAAGEGVIGEVGALAWKWHQLTGEKLWVLNAAVGGTCITEWTKGTACYENAVKLFRYAQTILSNEIDAGHYRLKEMGIIYHSAANYGHKGVTYTEELGKMAYNSIWNGFKADLAMDMDGDGTEETVTSLGLVPIWTAQNHKTFENDKAANYVMAASDSFPDVFMASLAGKAWYSDANVQKTFPEITYETHGEPVTNPVTTQEVYSDGVHYTQVAYNALGMNIAENLFTYLRKGVIVESVTLMDPAANKIHDEEELKVGRSIQLVLIVEPLTVNDLTITLSDNLSMEYPCVIKAEKAGEGTVTVSHGGKVLKTVTIHVEE